MRRFLVFISAVMLFSACQETLEQQAERTFREYTAKNCPQQISETIVLDSCRFEADTHTPHYFYHFMGVMDNDSVQEPVYMRQLLLDVLKNETSVRIYKENDYNFKYTYRSQKEPEKVLFEAAFTAADYR